MPRSEEQNKILRDERREEILAHAMHVFAKNGYSATKINDVAKEASLSPGLIYHYFESKEDMFTAVISQSIEITKRITKKIESLSDEPCEKLKLLTQNFLEYDEKSESAFKLFLLPQIRLSEAVPKSACQLFRNNFSIVSFVASLIKEGQIKGQFSTEKDAATLAIAYWSLMQGLMFFQAFNFMENKESYPIPDTDTILKILK